MDAAPSPTHCSNCDAELQAPYCGQCGQRAHLHPLSMKEILQELAEELFHIEGKLATTLKALLFRPGLLTLDHWRGRRARYVGPFKLYLTASILFFFAWAIHPPSLMNANVEFKSVELAGKPGGEPSELAAKLRADAATRSGLKRKLMEHAARDVELEPNELHRKVVQGFEQFLPKAMFVLIPAFALVLKLLYRKSKRLYAEHFVFALHFHAFVFVVLAVTWFVSNEGIKSILQLGILFYLFFALRRAYGQSVGKTLLKELLLTSAHGMLLALAMLIILFVSAW